MNNVFENYRQPSACIQTASPQCPNLDDHPSTQYFKLPVNRFDETGILLIILGKIQ